VKEALERMREEWNLRARADAHFFVAFGRRNQSGDEFFATAAEQVRALETELKRLPPAPPGSRRALEIGCGPGRLMRPLSRHFGEIHGVDISDEMIGLARRNLAGIPHAHPHHAPDSSLSAFADSSFDFVYSYAVFQHIPSREVVFGYLREAARILKPSGILRCQINGLPKTARQYDTWNGVRISAAEVREFAAANGISLLALEGLETQYMWATLRKGPCWFEGLPAEPRIRRITNAQNSEPAVPVKGPFSSVALWIQGLPPEADLNNLAIRLRGLAATSCYIGNAQPDGMRQVNAYLPHGLATGLAPMEVDYRGQPFCPPAIVRLMQPGPPVPRLISLRDGVDLLSGTSIVTGTLKAVLEEVRDPERLRVTIAGRPALDIESFCTDPRLPGHELNFRLPDGVPNGPAEVCLEMGRKTLARVTVDVQSTGDSASSFR
jgi:SAM-dependent methyltransferase